MKTSYSRALSHYFRNFDPKRIAVTGGSAGAASSLWLAYHDDLADPKSKDPVLRQSSRVCGAVAMGGQTTLDPFLLKEKIGLACIRHPIHALPLRHVCHLRAEAWPRLTSCPPL